MHEAGTHIQIEDFLEELRSMNLSLVKEEDRLVLKAIGELSAAEVDSIRQNQRIVSYIRNYKNELLDYISKSGENSSGSLNDNIESVYRLSGTQEGMLFHSLYDTEVKAYIEQFQCEFPELQPELLIKSWYVLTSRHSILRSSFYYETFNVAVQCLYREITIPVLQLDCRNLSAIEIEAIEKKDRQQGFDFTKAPLMRLTLLRLAEKRYRLLWTFHHILCDGWSIAVLINELQEVYQALAVGISPARAIEDKYEDYIRLIEAVDRHEEEKYWKSYMRGVNRPTLLPFISSRAPERTKGIGEYRHETLELTTDLTQKIIRCAQSRQVTLNTMMQAVWAYLLYRYTGEQDITYGIITSGRPEELSGVERRVGVYINTLPVHARINEDMLLNDWLAELQLGQVASRQYQHTRLNDIQNWINLPGDLFDSILVFENYPVSNDFNAPARTLQVERIHTHEQTNYPLGLMVNVGQQIKITFAYNSRLLDRSHVQLIKSHLNLMLAQISTQRSDLRISDLQIITGDERHKLLVKFNATTREFSGPKTATALFAVQIDRVPNKKALIYGDWEMTYSELDQRSNQVANYLVAMGVRQEQMIPVCMERGPDIVIVILGILKAGCAYVPIDPRYPQDRIQYMLNDLNAELILTTLESKASLSSSFIGKQILIDSSNTNLITCSTATPPVNIEPNNLAYVIYTSGSTGTPKGVMIEHKGVANLAHSVIERCSFNEDDRVLQFASWAFDASVCEMAMSLYAGATLVLIDDEHIHDHERFITYLEKHRVTVAVLPPAFLQMIGVDSVRRLRLLITAGEAAVVEQLTALSLKTICYNGYGPTEYTVCTSMYRVSASDAINERIPIGKPLANTRVYILDRHQRLVPLGVPGEICVTGAGLSRGYFNQELLTAEKFITNPFVPGERLYRTGDLGQWLPDGNIDYLGRLDEQVKIRGYRVELGEIESRLQQSSLVKQAVVIARADKNGFKQLVAYVIPCGVFDREQMMDYLSNHLPEFMVPRLWVTMESIPLTTHGKIDKRLLPDIDLGEQGYYVAPRNELERNMVLIWQELLKVERIGIHDNFFSLGGHSLLATRVVSAVRKKFAADLSIKKLFDSPTVAQLSAYLHQAMRTESPGVLSQIDRPALIPMSFSQERLWFIDQLEGSVHYHIPWALRLKGKVSIPSLTAAFRGIVQRHEILRTVIREAEGTGYQHILDAGQWEIELLDGHFSSEQTMQDFLAQLINKPFDLSKDYMLRVHLLTCSDDDHVMLMTVHHIASDAWSWGILIHELSVLYAAAEARTSAQLKPLPIQYADYAIWQRQYLTGQVLGQKLHYWEKQLTGIPPLDLSTDYPRPAMQSTKGGSSNATIDGKLYNELTTFSKEHGVTLYMTMLSAFKVLLYRYSGQETICVGSPIAGRMLHEFEGLIGFFVNTLVLRTDLVGSASFTEVLASVRTTTLSGYEYQDVPFEKIVERLVAERDLSRTPLFQVMFAMHNTHEGPTLQLGPVQMSTQPLGNVDHAKFDLLLTAVERRDAIGLHISFCLDLFKPETIARMMEHYCELLKSIVANPHTPVAQLEMLTQEERHRVLHTFNDTKIEYPDVSIADLFEEQVKMNPELPALVSDGESMSYRKLDERSNQLACYLRIKGVKEGSLVPICIERSMNMVIGILAILKAGGTYVPIDPEYPQARIQYMLEDVNASLVITNSVTKARLVAVARCELLALDARARDISQQPVNFMRYPVQKDQLGYIIYTSGSTGKPKGVEMKQQALVNLLLWQREQIDPARSRKILQYASINFDVSFQEIFTALTFGGTLYLVSHEMRRDMLKMLTLIRAEQINYLFVPYAVLKTMAECAIENSIYLDQLIALITAGEQLKLTPDIQYFCEKSGFKLINQYGPSESHVVSSYEVVSDDYMEHTLPPIGRSIANTQLYVLGPSLELKGVGMVGEICIGGTQVARGYVNKNELTSEKFIADPFSTSVGATLYKTGDLGRWLPDGNIEYLGRLDEQVKIRGYRIEPAEIESVVQQSGLVKRCVVIAQLQPNGDKRLIGYVVSKGKFSPTSIITYLKQQLPEHMVPTVWLEIANVPVTANGKIDKRALPKADIASVVQGDHMAPRNDLDRELIDIWRGLLNLETIGIHSNFFAIGGHSLLAMRVVSAIRKRLEVELSIKDLFQMQTVAQLSDHLSGKKRGLTLPALSRCERPEHIPLSFSQERLWFIDRLEGSIHYHIPWIIRLHGSLDVQALERSFQTIVTRHEVLRSVIELVDGTSHQRVMSSDGWKMDVIRNKDDQSLEGLISRLIEIPFDLSFDYMLRVHLIEVTSHEHMLVMTMHHIASDGWSLGIFAEELSVCYNAFANGRTPRLSPLQIQYADYAVWQRKHVSDQLLESRLRYWQEKLHKVSPLALLADSMRPAEMSTRGGELYFSIDQTISRRLESLAQQEDVTLFMCLIACFKILLYRYSGQPDVCVGTPIAGRTQQETHNLIGFFVNTLAIRSNVNGQMSFRELLKDVRQTLLDAYEHQDVPFEKIVEKVGVERDLSRSPLFQVMFTMQKNANEQTRLEFDKVTVTPYRGLENNQSKFDLAIAAVESATGLNFSVQYCKDLYRVDTVQRLIAHYQQLLSTVLINPGTKINDLCLLSEAEKWQLLEGYNTKTTKIQPGLTVIDLFRQQAMQAPDGVALVHNIEQMTYAELDARSNQLSHYLKSIGLKAGQFVPICIERGISMIIGVLGALKAGGVFVPIDAEFPAERIQFMLHDLNAQILLTAKSSYKALPDTFQGKKILLDEWHEIAQYPATAPEILIDPANLSYVVYTSGSTGKPKGVMIPHEGHVNMVLSQINDFDIMADDHVLQFASCSFDASISEVFVTLCKGATLVLIDKEDIQDKERFDACIKRHQVTVATLPPAYAKTLGRETLVSLRVLITAGEAAIVEQLSELSESVNCFNAYGPSEYTVCTSIYKVTPFDRGKERLPIGRPIANTKVFVLDSQLNLVPVGVPGEICITGFGLAKGYLNKEEITAEKFIANPFNPAEVLYRSGDFGRWLPDGNLEYLGRIDEQVKIRGFRIELGEIESYVMQSTLVKQGVVVDQDDKTHNRRLVGFVVAADNFSPNKMIDYLLKYLPEYMVPRLWVNLSEIPVTASGKVNRSALRSMNVLLNARDEYQPPRNELQIKLVHMWQDLLSVTQVGITDNFFRLGGHSLIVFELLSRIRKLGFAAQFRDIFRYQTIEELSVHLEANTELPAEASIEGVNDDIRLLNDAGEKPCIFILPGAPGFIDGYQQFAKEFAGIRNIYGVQMKGLRDGEQPQYTVEDIAHTNIRRIKEIQPIGPYQFIGHSLGSYVAFEMARQLEATGDNVQFIVMLDTASKPHHKLKIETTVTRDFILADTTRLVLETHKLIETPYPHWINQLQEKICRIADPDQIAFILDFVRTKIIDMKDANSISFTLRILKQMLVQSLFNYEAIETIDAHVLVVRAQNEDWAALDEYLGWKDHVGQVESVASPGDHLSLIQNTNSKTLANTIKAFISRVSS